MTARHKLNDVHLQGALALATFFGLATQSWTVFWLTAIALIGISLANRDIR